MDFKEEWPDLNLDITTNKYINLNDEKTNADVTDHDNPNPWAVESFDDFLYYCCPECNYKSQEHVDFNNHAIISHPMAREILSSNKSDDKQASLSDIQIQNEEDMPLAKKKRKQRKSRAKPAKEESEEEEELVEPKVESEGVAADDSAVGIADDDEDDNEAANNVDVKVEENGAYTVISSEVGTYRFQCSVCDKKSKARHEMIRHVKRVHWKVRPFGCKVCGKSFFREPELKLHVTNVHDKNQQWVCDICGHATSTKQSLQKHTLNKHVKTAFQCEYCKFVGPSAKRFYNHYCREHAFAIPSSNFKFSCAQCSKGFEFEPLLKLHEEYDHSEIDKLSCEKCGKQFNTKAGLKFHVAGFHEGLKPFSCQQCNKSFPTKGSLRIHKKMHEKYSSYGPEPSKFSCEKCNKQFATKNSLQLHVNGVHEGLKPYKCAHCEKAFPVKSSLETHTKIVHTKTGSIMCKICGQGTANVFYLRKHLKDVHSL